MRPPKFKINDVVKVTKEYENCRGAHKELINKILIISQFDIYGSSYYYIFKGYDIPRKSHIVFEEYLEKAKICKLNRGRKK